MSIDKAKIQEETDITKIQKDLLDKACAVYADGEARIVIDKIQAAMATAHIDELERLSDELSALPFEDTDSPLYDYFDFFCSHYPQKSFCLFGPACFQFRSHWPVYIELGSWIEVLESIPTEVELIPQSELNPSTLPLYHLMVLHNRLIKARLADSHDFSLIAWQTLWQVLKGEPRTIYLSILESCLEDEWLYEAIVEHHLSFFNEALGFIGLEQSRESFLRFSYVILDNDYDQLAKMLSVAKQCNPYHEGRTLAAEAKYLGDYKALTIARVHELRARYLSHQAKGLSPQQDKELLAIEFLWDVITGQLKVDSESYIQRLENEDIEDVLEETPESEDLGVIVKMCQINFADKWSHMTQTLPNIDIIHRDELKQYIEKNDYCHIAIWLKYNMAASHLDDFVRTVVDTQAKVSPKLEAMLALFKLYREVKTQPEPRFNLKQVLGISQLWQLLSGDKVQFSDEPDELWDMASFTDVEEAISLVFKHFHSELDACLYLPQEEPATP